jgi:hypothetical protein
MTFLGQNGPIAWKKICEVVPEITGNSGPDVQIPNKFVRISHRLTQINMRINHRLGELKKTGKIDKKMVKYRRGCYNILHNGKWKPLNNMKTVGLFFPAIEEQQKMESETTEN